MYAVITGASSGIGREIALLLAKKGYNLIITARRERRLLELKTAIEKDYGITVHIKPADLSDRAQVANFADFCAKFDIKILVNNAGFGKIGLFEEIELRHELDMIDTNITALHILTKRFSDIIKSGFMLNVASMSAYQPNPGLAAYGATKAYVLSLGRAIGYEFKKSGKDIFVTTVCPGPVDTEFNSVAKGSFTISAITAKTCARVAVNAMFRRKSVKIVGFKMKVLRFLTKILPTRLILPVEYRIQQSKKLPK